MTGTPLLSSWAHLAGDVVASCGTWLRCRVFGRHAFLLCFQADRIRLVCDTCGWESPGWDVGKPKGELLIHPAARARLLGFHEIARDWSAIPSVTTDADNSDAGTFV